MSGSDPRGEPAAWRCRYGDGAWIPTVHAKTVRARLKYGNWVIEPLYLTPPAPPGLMERVVEALAGVIDLAEDLIYSEYQGTGSFDRLMAKIHPASAVLAEVRESIQNSISSVAESGSTASLKSDSDGDH